MRGTRRRRHDGAVTRGRVSRLGVLAIVVVAALFAVDGRQKAEQQAARTVAAENAAQDARAANRRLARLVDAQSAKIDALTNALVSAGVDPRALVPPGEDPNAHDADPTPGARPTPGPSTGARTRAPGERAPRQTPTTVPTGLRLPTLTPVPVPVPPAPSVPCVPDPTTGGCLLQRAPTLQVPALPTTPGIRDG